MYVDDAQSNYLNEVFWLVFNEVGRRQAMSDYRLGSSVESAYAYDLAILHAILQAGRFSHQGPGRVDTHYEKSLEKLYMVPDDKYKDYMKRKATEWYTKLEAKRLFAAPQPAAAEDGAEGTEGADGDAAFSMD